MYCFTCGPEGISGVLPSDGTLLSPHHRLGNFFVNILAMQYGMLDLRSLTSEFSSLPLQWKPRVSTAGLPRKSFTVWVILALCEVINHLAGSAIIPAGHL